MCVLLHPQPVFNDSCNGTIEDKFPSAEVDIYSGVHLYSSRDVSFDNVSILVRCDEHLFRYNISILFSLFNDESKGPDESLFQYTSL